MSLQAEMQAMLDEISGGVEAAKWKAKTDGPPETEFFVADVGRWYVMVLRYKTGSAYAPYGYDGTATTSGIVLRLTRPLAERCFVLAQSEIRS